MRKKVDWIRHHKRLFTLRLPNGFSLDQFANIHQSGNITVSLSPSVLIGSFDFPKFKIKHRKDLGETSDFLNKIGTIIKTKRRI